MNTEVAQPQQSIIQLIDDEIERWTTIGHHALMQRFVRKHGAEGRALAKLPKKVRKGEKRQCFMNAYRLAAYHDFRYVEGYGISHNVPGLLIHHAWVLDKDGNVIDNTWDNPAGSLYFGVEFPFSEVEAETSKSGVYAVLDNGIGINHEYIFQRDPEIKEVVENIRKQRMENNQEIVL